MGCLTQETDPFLMAEKSLNHLILKNVFTTKMLFIIMVAISRLPIDFNTLTDR